jgi:hypothetical protein
MNKAIYDLRFTIYERPGHSAGSFFSVGCSVFDIQRCTHRLAISAFRLLRSAFR